jgi:hypothetical protein
VINANAFGARRRGRQPKPNKRVPLSLLVDPEIRRRLVHAAEENGRSITGETELTLKRGFNVFISYSSNDAPSMAELGVALGRPSESETSDPDKQVRDQSNRAIFLANTIGERAGFFLEVNYPGRSKDERIAHDLGISVGMAKLLRQGRAWTVARLDQALELWPEFRRFVFPAPRSDHIANRLEQLAAEFGRLADEFAELRQDLRNDRPRDHPSSDPANDGTA